MKSDGTQKSYVETARKRAKKAIDYYTEGKELKAVSEWKKIFGDDFPSQGKVKAEKKEDRYYSEKEQYIEQFYPVDFNENYFVKN